MLHDKTSDISEYLTNIVDSNLKRILSELVNCATEYKICVLSILIDIYSSNMNEAAYLRYIEMYNVKFSDDLISILGRECYLTEELISSEVQSKQEYIRFMRYSKFRDNFKKDTSPDKFAISEYKIMKKLKVLNKNGQRSVANERVILEDIKHA